MVTIIVARSRNRVIGRGGQLPWYLPADLAHFKKLTTGNTVIMGRKTFESIGKPLPNRTNIVVTANRNWTAVGVTVVYTLPAAIEHAGLHYLDEIFIIGGERIYQEALDRNIIDKIELTLVNCFIAGDAFFPLTPPEIWRVADEEVYCKDEKNEFDYAFLRYERASEYPSQSLLYLPAARFNDQAGYMEEILNDGVCPFCQEWLDWYHENPVEFETKHWIVTKNDNPYAGTSQDLLIIPKLHAENFLQLNAEEQADFGKALAETMRRFKLNYGAVGMRFGDMSRTGGSVAHLHAHIKVGDVDNPGHEPVRFKMSSVPTENKAPTLNE